MSSESYGDRYLSLAEAAYHLHVHENTLRRYIRSGQLPAVRIGIPPGRLRVLAADLDRIFVAKA